MQLSCIREKREAKIFRLRRQVKTSDVAALDVRSAVHLEAFLIKQGMLFFARL